MDCESEKPMLGQNVQESSKFKQYIATICVCFGALCAGTVLSWTAPALPQILITSNETNQTQFEEITGAPTFRINEQEESLVGSMLTVGALVAAIPIGILAGKIGRKVTIVSLSVPFLVSWILIIFCTNVEMIIAGRFFAGLGLGGICVVAPMYIGEIAEASSRGIFGSFFQMFLCTGVFLSCLIGYFTNWVGLALCLSVFPLIFGISVIFMPETPFYLVENNRMDEAEKVLKEFRGSHYNVSLELKDIQQEIQQNKENKGSIKDIITNKGNLKAVISVIGVMSFQQLCGINALVFYTSTIFKAAESTVSAGTASILMNITQVVVSYIAILVIEKANRKFYLISSAAGMMLCHAALGMFFHLKLLEVSTSSLGYVPLGSCIFFMVCFCLGFGPVPWMLLSELFSPEIKGIASGIAVLTNWIFAFIVTYCFPLMNIYFGMHMSFYIISGILASACAFVYFIVPETKGKSLSEIQEALNR